MTQPTAPPAKPTLPATPAPAKPKPAMPPPPPLPAPRKTVTATAGMLKFMRFGKKLVMYGKPGVGKTTLVVALLKAGHTVVYIDLDGNVEPFMMLPADLMRRLIVLPLRDTPQSSNMVKGLDKLGDKGIFEVCMKHAEHECPRCKKDNDVEWLTYNFYTDLPEDAIVVLDSYTQVHDGIINAVYKEHKLSDFDKMEIPNHGAVSRLDKVMSQFFLRSYFNCLLITHAASSKGIMDGKDAKDSWFPVLGSARTTQTSMKSATVVAMTRWDKPIVCETSLQDPYEVVLHQPLETIKGKKPADFVVQYFAKS